MSRRETFCGSSLMSKFVQAQQGYSPVAPGSHYSICTGSTIPQRIIEKTGRFGRFLQFGINKWAPAGRPILPIYALTRLRFLCIIYPTRLRKNPRRSNEAKGDGELPRRVF